MGGTGWDPWAVLLRGTGLPQVTASQAPLPQALGLLAIIAASFCCYVISDNESPVLRGCLMRY